MAFFSRMGKKKENKNFYSVSTIITEGTSSFGNIVGNDTIHVDGNVEGNIKVNNIVIIGKSGVVNGKIQAQQVMISGETSGQIICNSLEVMDSAVVSSHVKANKALVKGVIKATIHCDGLFVEKNGVIRGKVQAKDLVVSGIVNGDVACNVLSIKKSGFVRGKMFVNNMINEGGKVEGAIGLYNDLLTPEQMAKLKNGKSVKLLEMSDYYVDVPTEVETESKIKDIIEQVVSYEGEKNPELGFIAPKESIDEDFVDVDFEAIP
jgi:cytoskeletal protein CcmA (bactofilin family)